RKQSYNLYLTLLEAMMHFGNCNSAEYGRGTCIEKTDCDFYAVDKLTDFESKRQCFSRQRPELVCCPRETNFIPSLGARINNGTAGSTASPPITPLRLVPAPASMDALPQHPHCGTSFHSRVFGGRVTDLYEFPWTTLLEYSVRGGGLDFPCGAAFIAQRWLLTAAHCVDAQIVGPGRTLTAARLGEWNRDEDPDCVTKLDGRRECAPKHVRVTIDRILPHADFQRKNLTNDIALLRLSRPVLFPQPGMQHVEPVCLPPQRGAAANQLVGSAADVSGWGRTEVSESSKVKRKAMVTIQALEPCQEAFRAKNAPVDERQICAGGALGVDSCGGDSGGPLTVEASTPRGDRYVYLAGVVSFGLEECGKSEYSGVYTRVSSYMDWIEETIRANSR
ncbi:hypothetical protein KR054_008802, partial [Drosophila jambulina]